MIQTAPFGTTLSMTTTKTLCLMLLPVLALTTASAVHAAAGGPDPMEDEKRASLEDRLFELGQHFGDGAGFIALTTADDETLYVSFADPNQSFNFYMSGWAVDPDAVLAGCSVGPAGEPQTCDEAYGDAILVGLEDLALEDPDVGPDELTVDCKFNPHDSNVQKCLITWDSGAGSCWACQQETCTKYPAHHC